MLWNDLCGLTPDSIYTPVSQKALPSAKTQEMLEIQETFPFLHSDTGRERTTLEFFYYYYYYIFFFNFKEKKWVLWFLPWDHSAAIKN